MKKFNAEQETKNIISFIRNYYQENNLGEIGRAHV